MKQQIPKDLINFGFHFKEEKIQCQIRYFVNRVIAAEDFIKGVLQEIEVNKEN